MSLASFHIPEPQRVAKAVAGRNRGPGREAPQLHPTRLELFLVKRSLANLLAKGIRLCIGKEMVPAVPWNRKRLRVDVLVLRGKLDKRAVLAGIKIDRRVFWSCTTDRLDKIRLDIE